MPDLLKATVATPAGRLLKNRVAEIIDGINGLAGYYFPGLLLLGLGGLFVLGLSAGADIQLAPELSQAAPCPVELGSVQNSTALPSFAVYLLMVALFGAAVIGFLSAYMLIKKGMKTSSALILVILFVVIPTIIGVNGFVSKQAAASSVYNDTVTNTSVHCY